ncbi:MAG: hypothetical protein EU532_07260 [Promethearchaeota archaeon]|nr:MAG: hypothetical protein EU532_07260 [Candidatus Lokiarchaeota archaeon]
MPDIFTINISNSDLLWRVRAYVIGFLLADGSIQATNGYRVSASQHIRDIDVLNNIQMAIGGKISESYEENICYLNVYGKDLVMKIQDFGMVERHTKPDIAINILPPQFINMTINGQTLVRDFVRGYFEGDGCFHGNLSDRSSRFYLPGPENFLLALNLLILNEIPDITTFITPEKYRIYRIDQKEFVVYGGLKIYLKDAGFYQLTDLDLENGIIETKEHPWLKRLHIAGSFNCIKFFNWLYCDNDFFDDFEINKIHICGQRKFNKCLNVLGNSQYRQKRIAPNWSDLLPEITSLLKPVFYTTEQLMMITNQYLFNKLESLNQLFLYEENRVENPDIFRYRLKYLEFQDGLLDRVQERIGRSNFNYYFSTINPPPEIPSNLRRKIELLDRNENLKFNLKNLIVFIFLLNDNEFLAYKQILDHLIQMKVFKESTLRQNRVLLDIAELKSFEILVSYDEKENLEDQCLALNKSIIPKYYRINSFKLRELMEYYFFN